MSKKKVAIVATGGTIAGTGQTGKTVSYQAGRVGMEEIVASIPLIEEIAQLEMHQLFNLDSNEMDEAHWLELAGCINTLTRREDIDGIVVTHGTDTLEETAYFLNLVVHTQKPIVITGAMRPATATSADGLSICTRQFAWRLIREPLGRASWGFSRIRSMRQRYPKDQ